MNQQTILRIRYSGDTYIATDLSDTKRKVSCTMGAEAAAHSWLSKFEPALKLNAIQKLSHLHLDGIDTSKDKKGEVSYWGYDPAPASVKRVTVLKIWFHNMGWIAEEVATGLHKGDRAYPGVIDAARGWLRHFAPDVSTRALRPATEADLAAAKIVREDCREYYAFDVEDRPAVETPEATAPVEEAPAGEPVSDGRTITRVRTHQVEAHPLLERITLIPDAAAALGEVHHGDPKRMERHGELVEDWAAWVAEIREHGVIEPIRVVRRTDVESAIPLYYAVDGRHRLAAAKESERNSIPTILVKDEEIPGIIAGTVTARRHWTKSQRAWFAVVMNPGVATEAKVGRPAKNPAAAAGLISQADLASQSGVSERLLRDAIELYRGLEKHPHLKERFEPSLWGGASIEGLLQGFRAATDPAQSTGPGTSPVRHPVGKLSKIWTSERAHALNWEKADDDFRRVLANDLRTESELMPADYLEGKAPILETVIADQRRAAKDAAVPAPLSEA